MYPNEIVLISESRFVERFGINLLQFYDVHLKAP